MVVRYLGQGLLPCASLTGEFIDTPSINVLPFRGYKVTTPLLFSIVQCTGSTPVPATKISASRFDPSVILPVWEMKKEKNEFISWIRLRGKKCSISSFWYSYSHSFLRNSLYFSSVKMRKIKKAMRWKSGSVTKYRLRVSYGWMETRRMHSDRNSHRLSNALPHVIWVRLILASIGVLSSSSEPFHGSSDYEGRMELEFTILIWAFWECQRPRSRRGWPDVFSTDI